MLERLILQLGWQHARLHHPVHRIRSLRIAMLERRVGATMLVPELIPRLIGLCSLLTFLLLAIHSQWTRALNLTPDLGHLRRIQPFENTWVISAPAYALDLGSFIPTWTSFTSRSPSNLIGFILSPVSRSIVDVNRSILNKPQPALSEQSLLVAISAAVRDHRLYNLLLARKT